MERVDTITVGSGMCNRWVDRSWRRWRRCHENDTGRWRHRQSLVDNPHWERIPKNPQESPRIPEMLNQIKETQSDENIRFTKDNICLRFLLFHFHLEAKKRPRGQQQKARQIYLYKYIWERFKKEKNLMKAMRKRRERKRRRRRRRRRRKMLMLMETEKNGRCVRRHSDCRRHFHGETISIDFSPSTRIDWMFLHNSSNSLSSSWNLISNSARK